MRQGRRFANRALGNPDGWREIHPSSPMSIFVPSSGAQKTGTSLLRDVVEFGTWT